MHRSLLVAACLTLWGCGLVDPDITNFDLALPPKTFTVDTKNWPLANAGPLASQSCTPSSDVCPGLAQTACPEQQCAAQCNAATSTCDLTLFITLYTSINLKDEKPELQSIEDEPIISVTIDDITYAVGENTLNVDTPEMKVYAAPSTVTRAGDPMAREFATVPPIDAGVVVPETALALTSAGRTNLATFMGDFQTTFNIVVGSNLMVRQGDPVPDGRLVVTVNVKAHAGL